MFIAPADSHCVGHHANRGSQRILRFLATENRIRYSRCLRFLERFQFNRKISEQMVQKFPYKVSRRSENCYKFPTYEPFSHGKNSWNSRMTLPKIPGIAHEIVFSENCGKCCYFLFAIENFRKWNPDFLVEWKKASQSDIVLLVNDCFSGRTPNGAAIKGIDKKGQTRTPNHPGPSAKRVKFDSRSKEEEMETEIEDPGVIINEGSESTSVARAPSFYIGKPLKDYDASNGRVSASTCNC